MLNLKDAKQRQFYTISGYAQQIPFKNKRRLLELGLTLGQKVRLLRKSLLKKAYLIEVRGYVLSLRSDLASFILLRGQNG